jgi:hypothetical protein
MQSIVNFPNFLIGTLQINNDQFLFEIPIDHHLKSKIIQKKYQ